MSTQTFPDMPNALEVDQESQGFSLKSPTAYRTIGEVSAELNIPQHVLRFWEDKFPTIRPVKRGGGRRYYRAQDIDTIKRIKHLLYEKGYTIKGVQQINKQQPDLNEDLFSHEPQILSANQSIKTNNQDDLRKIIQELLMIRENL